MLIPLVTGALCPGVAGCLQVGYLCALSEREFPVFMSEDFLARTRQGSMFTLAVEPKLITEIGYFGTDVRDTSM